MSVDVSWYNDLPLAGQRHTSSVGFHHVLGFFVKTSALSGVGRSPFTFVRTSKPLSPPSSLELSLDQAINTSSWAVEHYHVGLAGSANFGDGSKVRIAVRTTRTRWTCSPPTCCANHPDTENRQPHSAFSPRPLRHQAEASAPHRPSFPYPSKAQPTSAACVPIAKQNRSAWSAQQPDGGKTKSPL